MNRTWWAALGLAATTFLWAANAVVSRGLVGHMPPISLAFWRWTLAGAILIPLTWQSIRSHWPLIRPQLPWLALLAVLSVGAYNSILYMAVQKTTAINTALMNTLIPMTTMLAAWLMLGARPTGRQTGGMLLGFVGMIVIVSKANWQVLASLAFNHGDLLMLVAVGCWALYSVLLKKRHLGIPPVTLLAVVVMLGVPMILPFYVWEWSQQGGFAVDLTNLAAIGFTGVFASIVAYLLWNHGVGILGPSAASLFIFLMPVFGALLGVTLLGEALLPYHGIGGVLILAGLVLGVRK
ncbi:EamA family transporter [Pokkaliibacter plantistimulans]|uniref:EamA family transporter n=1 Tax=Proteobacteria bacterium 228 TaxID=2083153 RepID=A0A2S5KIZ0_9PROT|nr:DMT family transporter [Pokkaliibacter plantistimulans]PPC74748.1 EamA family transporter [Pokkaliibacter plantistimulans]